jgi:EpsI family protein
MTNSQPWIPGVLLAGGCLLLLGVNRQQTVSLSAPLSGVSHTFAGYVGTDLEIPKADQKVAGMSTYLFRTFTPDAGPGFSVYVGYYDHQTQGKTIHSPKNCLPGAGWEMLESTQNHVQVGGAIVPVNRYMLQKNGQRALVFYWYQGRGRVAANEYQVKWELLRDAAIRGRTEEALVRIVVYLDEKHDAAAAAAVATAVAADLIPALDRVLPA